MECKSRRMRAIWESMKDLYRWGEASILCTQSPSNLFNVNGSQVKKGAPTGCLTVLIPDSAGTQRLWTEQSKKPTTRRSSSVYLGLSRQRTTGKKKKRMETARRVRPGPWWKRSESCPARPAPRWRRLRST